MQDRTLELLADGEWHSGRELALKVSHRFGAYLFRLRAKGVTIERRLEPGRPDGAQWWEYRDLDAYRRTAGSSFGVWQIHHGRGTA